MEHIDTKPSVPKKMCFFHPAQLVSTGLGVGKIPFAPGTFGSLLGYPFFLFLLFIASLILHFSGVGSAQTKAQNLMLLLATMSVILLICAVIFTFAIHKYLKHTDKTDPGEVVIDEIVGQAIALIMAVPLAVHLSEFSDQLKIKLFLIVLPFILFRIFDIFKPWPIDWCDTKIKGALGVMLDDVVAGIMAGFVHYIIFLMLMKWHLL